MELLEITLVGVGALALASGVFASKWRSDRQVLKTKPELTERERKHQTLSLEEKQAQAADLQTQLSEVQ